MTSHIFIFMGRPGAGKGMQSGLLSEKIGIPIFSTGGRVRELAKEDTTLGRKVKAVSESGDLTPYWFASFLFEQALFDEKNSNGIIFEGVGRKEPEVRLFAEIMEWLGQDFRVLNLNVSAETATERLVKRGAAGVRADDTADKIKLRLDLFEKETAPAIEYFRSIGKVIDVDGEPLPDVVFAEVCQKLGL